MYATAHSGPSAGALGGILPKTSRHCALQSLQRKHRGIIAFQISRWSRSKHAAARSPSSRHVHRCLSATDAVEPLEVTEKDRLYMQQALELARRGLGKTEPNPAVGCVIVKDDQVIGEGFHPKAGEPHAEVFALRGAGQAAEGATAYVTLEPCNHYGRTPPCSQALVAAKVAKVFVGVGDPNPLVGGTGITTLTKAGIAVAMIGGQEEADCYAINRGFMERMKLQAQA